MNPPVLRVVHCPDHDALVARNENVESGIHSIQMEVGEILRESTGAHRAAERAADAVTSLHQRLDTALASIDERLRSQAAANDQRIIMQSFSDVTAVQSREALIGRAHAAESQIEQMQTELAELRRQLTKRDSEAKSLAVERVRAKTERWKVAAAIVCALLSAGWLGGVLRSCLTR